MTQESETFTWTSTTRTPRPPAKPIPLWQLPVRIVCAVAPHWALAGTFLITWISPYYFGERMVHHLTFVMLVEFIVVHSTGFTGALANQDIPRLPRIGMFIGLMLLYSLFAAGFAAMYKGWWPVIAFAYLVASKLPSIVTRPASDDAMMGIMANWAAMVCLYLGGLLAVFSYNVPPLGVTPEVIARQAFDVGGEFPEKPYIALAFGVFYFTGLGLLAIITETITYFSSQKNAAST